MNTRLLRPPPLAIAYGHEIAMDYYNPNHPIQLYWGGGDSSNYKEYPDPACL